VLARAHAAGVGGAVIIGVGEDLAPARNAIAIAKRHPGYVRATAGVHPHDATTLRQVFEELSQLAQAPEVSAIGETGLDYHYDHSPRELQREAFVLQIGLSRKLKKPLVIHTRAAADETLELLRAESASDVGGVIHCFSEDVAFAKAAIDLNFYVSFSGIVTFKKAQAIQEAAAWVPSDRILVETDSPYLAPVPFRGKSCEPAYVRHTAEFVAGLRKQSLEELAQQTSANAKTLFGVTTRD
jgi:TatD DNase family protein